MPTPHKMPKLLSIIAIFAMLFSMIQPATVQAQGQSGDGIKRQVNAENGKLSFIGPESGRAIPAAKALGTLLRPQNPGLALAKRFAPEFGVKNPQSDLSERKSHRAEDGRLMVRYQQTYRDVPVMAGELIVNTNDSGDLYSMSGEVSPDLALSTQPTIDSAQARTTALQAMTKWYKRGQGSFIVSEPQLWIYDESLLQQSNKPVELVWRMEVTAKNDAVPLRELVLVNAQNGGISLHFNQIDTAWTSNPSKSTLNVHDVNSPVATDSSVLYSPETVTATTWYVATMGDDSNSCTSAGSPCKTINGAITKSTDGDTIKVAIGTYTGPGSLGSTVVLINKSITLLGGWNVMFTGQNGLSIIDGQNVSLPVYVSQPNPLVTVVLDRFDIKNGYGGEGGGVYNGGDLTINNSSIHNNSTNPNSGSGGGVFNNTKLTLNNTTINSNSSANGGGIYSNNILGVTLNNTTITSNSAFYGGAIYAYSDNLLLNNTTISNNEAYYGGGIYNLYGVVTLQNSILAQNTAFSAAPDCYATVISTGYNLIGNNSNCTFSATTGDVVGTGVSPINSKLAPLQNNGGYTFTHALIIGSPAIDAGNPATCLSTDQRGVARPVGAKCDIGAYEGSIAWAPPYLIQTYTANNNRSVTLPGTFICDQTDPICFSGDLPAKAAHKYAIGTFNLYSDKYSRNSIDGKGMVIKSTVHYCSPDTDLPCAYPNANWTGEQMVYGDAYGFANADDVVAHELTHGVTQYESNLFYAYQSGAINESFSDVFGEYYDQTNGQGYDAANVKWLFGEDVTGLGALRSMSNPLAYNDPDRMTSAYYQRLPYEDDNWDNGGVHTNSGVNNKAAFLMVDGETFNGKTVTGLGWEKVGAIYYEVNTNLLTSGADYSDLYYALQQACNNLIGQKGITGLDCAEVKDAVDAVEMNAQPVPNFNTDAPVCDPGKTANIVFADNLENGTGNWTFTNGTYPRWQYDSWGAPYVQSGNHSLYADDYPAEVTDAKARLRAIAIPANAYLWFAQVYEFESYASAPYAGNYDGGVLEYNISGSSTWIDAGSLMQYNGYRGMIYNGSDGDNPLKGKNAFVGASHGYISTRLNLSSLAGKTVNFRWRMGLDTGTYFGGWWVDNVKVYTCIPTNMTISGNAGVPGASLNYTGGSTFANGSGNYSFTVPFGWSGTVTPSKAGYAFSPASRTYANISANQPFQNYTTTPYPTISGNTNIADVILSYTDNTLKTVTSQSNGDYSLMVPPGWSGAVAPSHPCFTFTPSLINHSAVWSNKTAQNYTPGSINPSCANINVLIGGANQGHYGLQDASGARASFTDVDGGPVKIVSTNGVPLIASQRINLKTSPTYSSYSEFMGLLASKLTDTYIFPWYNNATAGGVQSQIRFGNVGNAATDVTIKIGATSYGPYHLNAGESNRVAFENVDSGPVEVKSSDGVAIIASMRINLKTMPTYSSYSEFMGLPSGSTPGTSYMFPWYNNATAGGLQSQIRFGNVGTSETDVTVKIGANSYGPYHLNPGESNRQSFDNVDAGPVEVLSSGGVSIIAAMRVNLKTNPTYSSYSEFMGLPGETLTETRYLFPWYNNATAGGVQSQLRFANVGNATTTVSIKIAGVTQAQTYILAPNESARVTLNNVDSGPVEVFSNGQPIIVSMRINLKSNALYSSYSEFMGLSVGNGMPGNELSPTYWFPWYNNATAGGLNSQLRFGAP